MNRTAADDDTATVLAEIWQDLLEVDEVRTTDRLLQLGGNSLVATMVANRIELFWGFRPSMESLLTATLGELSAECSRLRTPE
ncbi:MAG TPA: phosphopantetheine-binding protein [Streptomyces sp.]